MHWIAGPLGAALVQGFAAIGIPRDSIFAFCLGSVVTAVPLIIFFEWDVWRARRALSRELDEAREQAKVQLYVETFR